MRKITYIIKVSIFLVLGVIFLQCEREAIASNTDNYTNLNQNRQNDRSNGDLCSCLENQYTLETLSEDEINAILLMREEEKLARDVYIGLYDMWDATVFTNISKAEQRHMDALLCIIERYGLEDPVLNNPTGEFNNPDLQQLYNDLIDKGQENVIEAFRVGATIEDLDIADLMDLSEKIDNKDLLAVFGELTRGSRNHLRAFNRNLNNLNEEYEAVYIPQVLFEEIVQTSVERGSQICVGTCNNQGRKGNQRQREYNGGSGTCPNNGG